APPDQHCIGLESFQRRAVQPKCRAVQSQPRGKCRLRPAKQYVDPFGWRSGQVLTEDNERVSLLTLSFHFHLHPQAKSLLVCRAPEKSAENSPAESWQFPRARLSQRR